MKEIVTMVRLFKGGLEIQTGRNIKIFTLSNECVNNLLRVLNGEIEFATTNNVYEFCEEIIRGGIVYDRDEYTFLGLAKLDDRKCEVSVKVCECGRNTVILFVIWEVDGVPVPLGFGIGGSSNGYDNYRNSLKEAISETLQLPGYRLEEDSCQL